MKIYLRSMKSESAKDVNQMKEKRRHNYALMEKENPSKSEIYESVRDRKKHGSPTSAL